MPISRRSLLASLAAVAAAATVGGFPAVALDATTRREASFWGRYVWAYDAYSISYESGDYSAWEACSIDRFMLAQLWMDLRALADPTEAEAVICEAVEDLWFALTQPRWPD